MRLRLINIAVIALALTAGIARAECPPLRAADEKRLEHRQGRFADADYGYSVAIPPGHEALLVPPPEPSHGFDVWLAHEPPRKMYVLAYAKPRDWSLDRVVTDVIGVLREGETGLKIGTERVRNVGPWRTTKRIAVAYPCRTADPWIEIVYVSLHSSGRFYYTVGVVTQVSHRKEDEAALRAMLTSWRELPQGK